MHCTQRLTVVVKREVVSLGDAAEVPQLVLEDSARVADGQEVNGLRLELDKRRLWEAAVSNTDARALRDSQV